MDVVRSPEPIRSKVLTLSRLMVGGGEDDSCVLESGEGELPNPVRSILVVAPATEPI